MKKTLIAAVLIVLFTFSAALCEAGTLTGDFTYGTVIFEEEKAAWMVTGKFDAEFTDKFSGGIEVGIGDTQDTGQDGLNLMVLNTAYEMFSGVFIRLGYGILSSFDLNFSGFRTGLGLKYATPLDLILSGHLDYIQGLEVKGEDVTGDQGLDFELRVSYNLTEELKLQGGYKRVHYSLTGKADQFIMGGFFIGTAYSF